MIDLRPGAGNVQDEPGISCHSRLQRRYEGPLESDQKDPGAKLKRLILT